MKYVLSLILLTTLMGCESSAQSSIENILTGLEKSYVRNIKQSGSKNQFLEEYNVTPKQYGEDSLRYNKAIRDFYNSSSDIIENLLLFEKDTTKYCNWLGTKSPYSSTIKKGDLVSKSKGALALIDCYILLDDKNRIYMNDYVDKISFKAFVNFFQDKKSLDRENLKKEYLIFLTHLR